MRARRGQATHSHSLAKEGKKALRIRLLDPSLKDAIVSIVHSETKNPEEITKQVDIIIAAAGQRKMVRGSWMKPGAVLIDVKINSVEYSTHIRGYKLVGDICYEEACRSCTL